MKRALGAFTVFVACSGCSSFDEQRLAILRRGGELAVDRSQPEALAMARVDVLLVAGSRAGGDIEVVELHLYEGADPLVTLPVVTLPVQLALPTRLAGGEVRTVALDNLSTTNADLTPHCGREFSGVAWVQGEEGQLSGYLPAEEVTIRCQ